MAQIIAKKRRGGALDDAEIRFVVDGYVADSIPDYQVSALLMAILFTGMTETETATLTSVMTHSGRVLDLSWLGRPVVDKHSTGGIGDKTSFVIAPIAAAAGLAVPMISGRGLGHSGGTLDKFESIPGLRVDVTLDEFRELLERNGTAIVSATAEIAPADRKIYALRDTTATVGSIPLVASSIMSKKLAAGLEALVLDVKSGSGAFMKTDEEACRLARALCAVGARNGTRTEALVTRMDGPLGRAVGHSIEVVECIEVLRGEGPADLADLSLELAARMISLGRSGTTDESLREARAEARRQIESGAALDLFRRMVEAQGGDPRAVDDPSLLERAQVEAAIRAERDGWVGAIDGEAIGWAVNDLGAGRRTVADTIDHGVGLILDARIGDEVRAGDALGHVLARDEGAADEAAQRIRGAITIADAPPDARPLVIDEVRAPDGAR